MNNRKLTSFFGQIETVLRLSLADLDLRLYQGQRLRPSELYECITEKLVKDSELGCLLTS